MMLPPDGTAALWLVRTELDHVLVCAAPPSRHPVKGWRPLIHPFGRATARDLQVRWWLTVNVPRPFVIQTSPVEGQHWRFVRGPGDTVDLYEGPDLMETFCGRILGVIAMRDLPAGTVRYPVFRDDA